MKPADNELITRVGPGTPCGNLLRRYWWPIACAEHLTQQPMPVRLLGEDLVLFRTTDGTLGLLNRYCSHRGTSLEFGRVEDRGIRCCYHGWLFDSRGRCLDQPAEPEGSTLKHRIKHGAYSVREVSGLIFAYLGPEPVPSFPRYDLLFADDCNRVVVGRETHCNWLQRAENILDPHHIMALHAGIYPEIAMRRPEVSWEQKWYGFRMVSDYPNGIRDVHHHLFPAAIRVNVVRVGQQPSQLLLFNVPVDDTETIYYMVWAYPAGADPATVKAGAFQRTTRGDYKRVEDGWWGIWERDQDDAAQENQGPGAIADRSVENLGTSDRGIVLFRRALREAIEDVAAGRDPMGVIRTEQSEPIIFDAAKSGIVHADDRVREPELGEKLGIREPFDLA